VTTLALVAAVTLLLLTGVIRAAGASLVRTPRADALQDAHEGDHRAAVIAELLDDRATLQPALGIFHTGLLVMAAVPATWALTRTFEGLALLWAVVVLGVVLVVFGDVLPRNIGRSRPRRLAYQWAWLLRPVVDLGRAAADLISDVDDEEIDEPQDEADSEAERELLSSVLEFRDTIVREVMVPRPDMITLDGASTTDDALDLVIEAGRSRIPVLGEGIDDVVGVLYARDLLQLYDDNAAPMACVDLARAPYFVPETKPVFDLMREMQANQIHLAIVVDEYGGTAGLVTIEDLLEEIVGEIVDEYDDEEPMVTKISESEFLVDARLAIDELEELIGVELPGDEWDTVGGLVLGLAGRVPREGESFDLAEHVLTAERVQGRRVARVRLEERL
jgi:CBS domain containing-hemolysin-like protein